MTIERETGYLQSLLKELVKQPNESEWFEFKKNNKDPAEIGEYISALANSAALVGKPSGYLIWGVDDATHELVGTDFKPSTVRHKQQELESWILQKLEPKIHFRFFEFRTTDERPMVVLEIKPAMHTPVKFNGVEYVRVGSYKKKLCEFPEKERELWRTFDYKPFENEIAAENVRADDVLKLINYPGYFYLINLPLPDNRVGVLEALKSERIILESKTDHWNITNFGAVLFAKKLSAFHHLKRKAVRVVQYKGVSKYETIREEFNDEGYALGYENLIKTIMQLIPSYEFIEHALRKTVSMFPELAIRELVANAMIHQDFYIRGTSIMVELFSNRIEITNPGLPLVKTDRFLDSPPRSLNEGIASFMRRVNICEERGSGIDKVVMAAEAAQLPAPIFRTTEEHTIAILSARKKFKEMDKSERTHACYLHASLRYVQNNPMTNTTLRERFAIDVKNSAMVSRVISDAIEAKLIRCNNESVGTKARKYVPWWA